jgi:hypothetical protein
MDDPPWVRWRNDVFGDPYTVWHEGPEYSRLIELAGTAPADVAHMLAAGLDAQDPLAAQSIAALAGKGLAPGDAEALLRAALAVATEEFLVRVAQALHVVTGDEAWAGPVASVLTSDASWGVRLDAARVLEEFTPTTELVGTLAEGVRDEEYLVRYHSANTLLRYAGRGKGVADHHTLFDKVASPPEGDATETDREKWRQAADQLTALASPRTTGG